MANKHPFSQQAQRLQRTLTNLPRQVGVLVVGETKANFRRQAFDGQAWPKRKSNAQRDTGRNLLIDSGVLRRSIRSEAQGRRVTIFSDVPYAKVHNDGGSVKKRTSKRSGYKSKRKGGATFQMPKRQFLGDSKSQREKIDDFVSKQFQKALNT